MRTVVDGAAFGVCAGGFVFRVMSRTGLTLTGVKVNRPRETQSFTSFQIRKCETVSSKPPFRMSAVGLNKLGHETVNLLSGFLIIGLKQEMWGVDWYWRPAAGGEVGGKGRGNKPVPRGLQKNAWQSDPGKVRVIIQPLDGRDPVKESAKGDFAKDVPICGSNHGCPITSKDERPTKPGRECWKELHISQPLKQPERCLPRRTRECGDKNDTFQARRLLQRNPNSQWARKGLGNNDVRFVRQPLVQPIAKLFVRRQFQWVGEYCHSVFVR